MSTSRLHRKTIAILGGGLGGLGAAFALTSRPRWYEQYRIDVYQKGWRLGGKGASGRGAHGRIQEHGLHCFWGFYDNTFSMLRTCYDEIHRTTGPLRTVDEAFQRLDYVHFIDELDGRWCRYRMQFPENDERPGTGPRLTEMSVARLGARFIEQVAAVLAENPEVGGPFHAAVGGGLPEKLVTLGTMWASVVARAVVHVDATSLLASLLGAVSPPAPAPTHTLGEIDDVYGRYVLFQTAKFAFVMLKGLITDGVPATLDGFGDPRFDDLDLRQWLQKHGADADLLASPIVRGFYDASFCYPGGDFAHPNLSAGVSLRTILLMGFTYKGSFMWKMRASMGDVVFGPIYQALVHRGIAADHDHGGERASLAFHFFHDVKKLSLDATKRNVDAVAIDVQAQVARGPYVPMITIRDLPCWPAEPLYDQLADGDALKGFDLESDWSAPPVRKRSLRRGVDFDSVVLAIPVAGLRTICSELVDAAPAWRDMVEKVKTIRTKSVQVWLRATPEQARWQADNRLMTDVYKDDFNSVTDMFQTLPFEDWPAGSQPGGVVYTSTAMADDPDEPQGPSEGYQAAQNKVVSDQWRAWLARWQEGIFGWLGADFDPGAFVDEYARANVSADQRYTLSVAGSAKYRLKPDASGFDNLFLAGDWTRSPLDLGCAENATMSGLLAGDAAARAMQPARARTSPFVAYPAMPVYPPPYRQTGITLCQFVLDAQASRLQSTLDRYLNPAAGEHRFRALGKWAILQTGFIEGNVGGPPDEIYGTGQETSATFLVPCLRWRGGGLPGALPVEAGFFAPFVFVDHPLSVIAGREVLGMAKQLATFEGVMPDDLDNSHVKTMAVKHFGSTSPVEPVSLLQIRRGTRPGGGRPRSLSSFARPAIDALASAVPDLPGDLLSRLFDRLLTGRQVTFFSLRQLRDTRAPGLAAFQEVTRGRMELGHVELETLPGAHAIQITRVPSYPIAECLGLAHGPLTPVAKLKIRVDRATLDVEP